MTQRHPPTAELQPERMRREPADESLAAQLLEIGGRCAASPELDNRSADEILGYDDRGLPS